VLGVVDDGVGEAVRMLADLVPPSRPGLGHHQRGANVSTGRADAREVLGQIFGEAAARAPKLSCRVALHAIIVADRARDGHRLGKRLGCVAANHGIIRLLRLG